LLRPRFSLNYSLPDLTIASAVDLGTPEKTPRFPANLHGFGVFLGLIALAALFAGELLVLSLVADGADLANRGIVLALLAASGAWILRCIVGFAALFVTFGYLKSKATFDQISNQLAGRTIGTGFLAAHFAAILLSGALTLALFKTSVSGLQADMIAGTWLVAGVSAIVFAALAILPPTAWIQMVRGTGYLWLYTLTAVVAACIAGSASRSLWKPMARLTFSMVEGLLRLMASGVTADPVKMIIGTSNFRVEIADECSGFEGVGLMLAFGIVWLGLFRKECRFPQALLLIPAGVIVVYLLNAVRIAALILIGNAGAREIAVGGFHSQAGWIAFNLVALGFSVAARRMPYFSLNPPKKDSSAQAAENPTTAYLIPFLAILGAGMLSGAMSGKFEWFYPLRFFAAAGALWAFRGTYSKLDWRVGWLGPSIGAAVFLLWIGIDRMMGNPVATAMPAALASSSAAARVAWLAFRVLAATVTVPIAEELAFRGFLLRRLVSADFESVPFSRFTWVALLVSSVLFGALHGSLWFPGILAGLLYAFAAIRKGRIGEAVAAHATTNALLAAYVLLYGAWHLW
jgi:exosortase E/protease (VPEID-CTERM system)